jgi:hypothetical protein
MPLILLHIPHHFLPPKALRPCIHQQFTTRVTSIRMGHALLMLSLLVHSPKSSQIIIEVEGLVTTHCRVVNI